MSSIYLERYAWKEELFPNYQPSSNLGLIIVLPAFKEEFILHALNSLNQCQSPKQEVLILVIVNESDDASQDISSINKSCLTSLKRYNSKFQLLTSYQKLPSKKAGVGLARKIGMDEAVRLFHKCGNNGVIICYDADSICDDNYLVEIEKVYEDDTTKSGIVFYEHQLHRENHKEILNYELYLRYYIDALRHTGFPYAHQTLGSCISVRCSQYEKVGGMNTRKAGEDFYFLNKTIPLGGFVEINNTTVRPSDRISDRVPFGTGKAVNEIKHSEDYEVYHPNTFEDLKLFFSNLDSFWNEEEWKISKTMESFLGMDWKEEIRNLKEKVNSKDAFEKRFYHWFDAFQILKFVHFARDHFYQNVELQEALDWLRNTYSRHLKGDLSGQLIQLRYFDRGY